MPRSGWQIALGISGAVALVTGAWGMKDGEIDSACGLGTKTPRPGPEAVA
jgi:hypothetical protein